MRLTQTTLYAAYGLDERSLQRLSLLGDLLLAAGFNVTGITDPEEAEKMHFLDSLSLLRLDWVARAERLADAGSGAGLPALVLALALPRATVTAIESQRKKCGHIAGCAAALALENVEVVCARMEDYARTEGRESHDVVVSRAVASLPVLVEYSLPLLRVGGHMVAMKGAISDQERTRATTALDILGGEHVDTVRTDPFPGCRDRWAYVARKAQPTPERFPRRAGIPAKRPLGARPAGPQEGTA